MEKELVRAAVAIIFRSHELSTPDSDQMPIDGQLFHSVSHKR